jgi:hypothetical protein
MGFSAQSLVEIYKTMALGAWGVEIGVCRGENIKQLLDACQNIRKIIGIDPWAAYQDKLTITQETAEEWYQVARYLLREYIWHDRVKLIRKPSLEAVESFEDNFLDFSFIDGNHSYPIVLADLAAWWPKVKPGGIFSGHDFRTKDTEVRRAVYEFAQRLDVEVIETEPCAGVGPTCWHIIKPGDGK